MPEAGTGWNHLVIDVDDLPAEIERLHAANVDFRNEIATGAWRI